MVDDASGAPSVPLTDDILADFHAGALDADAAERVRAALPFDTRAQEFLASLDEVTALTRARGADLTAEAPMPPDVRERLDVALAGAARPDTRPTRRRAIAGPRWAVAAAAAVVVIAAGAAVGVTAWSGDDRTPSQAAPTSSPNELPSVDGLSPRLIADTMGLADPGRYADPALLRECLRANGFDPDTRVIASSPVVVDGRESTLLVLPGPAAPTVTALAVGDACGAGNPDTVSRADIG